MITFMLAESFTRTGTSHILMVPAFAAIMALVYFVPPSTNIMETHYWYRL